MHERPVKISLHCAGRYAVSEIYNGISHAIKKAGHILTDTDPEISIMIRGVRASPPKRPNILILTDEPYEVDKTSLFSPKYDLVFTNEKSTIDRHPKSVFLPLAYDPILKAKPTKKEYDICHIGGAYPGRKGMVVPVFNKFKNSVLIGPQWPRISRVRKQLIKFDDHIDYYRKSRIVLNIHRNDQYSAFGRLNTRCHHEATHLAPRVWNCGAIGTFQIIDSKRNNDMVPSLVKAATAIELIHKCEYYLAHEVERETIARKQASEIQPHSWVARIGFILNTANEYGLIK